MTLVAIYLFLNAILYAVLAVWCTMQWRTVARSLGYTQLDASGRVEFLTIYGGLQWGLAIVFFLAAREPGLHLPALIGSIAFYAPLVAYRLASIATGRGSSARIRNLAIGEAVLLGMAVALFALR